MFRHQALITCKRQLKSLTQLSFSLMGESESGAKVDDEENGLADHQYSRKLFLKTRPLRGLLSFPPRCRSPPSSMSSTKLSLKAPPQIQMIIHCHVGVRRATLRPPPWRRWGHPANLQLQLQLLYFSIQATEKYSTTMYYIEMARGPLKLC